MRVFPTCLLALCALCGAQSAAAQRTVLNHAAFVTSADGYANVRAQPSSRSEIIGRVTDEFFLVISCEPGREGRRWCFTGRSRADENLSSGDRFGWIHESQFAYDPVGDAPDETLEGYEVAEPLRAYEPPETRLWVDSRDGYVNLRAGPGSDHRVLRPLPNGARLHIFGCGPRSRRARWCLVQDEGTRIVGYAYDAELRHEPR